MTSPVRLCVECNGSMTGKRPHAVYCSRRCKTIASDRRRLDDRIGNVVPACPPVETKPPALACTTRTGLAPALAGIQSV